MTPSNFSKTHRYIVITLFASLALNACGIRGSLKTPPPLPGEKIYVPESEKTDTPTLSEQDNE